MVSGKDNPLHDGGNLVASGQLKIFFGYAAGVGKTYAMLEAAHQAQKEGIDVVAVSYTHLYNRKQYCFKFYFKRRKTFSIYEIYSNKL